MLILTDDGKIVEGTQITEEEQEIYKTIVEQAYYRISTYLPSTERNKLATWLISEYKITPRSKPEPVVEESVTEAFDLDGNLYPEPEIIPGPASSDY